MRKIDSVLHERLAKLIKSMGCELVGGELQSRGRQVALMLYIDSASGVTVDDCSKVSQQVSAMLDVEDFIQGRYTLEVSSPGINRPLFTIEHYQKHIGKQVKVRLAVPVNQRKQYKGILKRIEGEDIYLLTEIGGIEIEVKLPFSIIEKANLIADVRL